jgi:dihydroorotase/N-acyl-D-amino-acid deacylase
VEAFVRKLVRPSAALCLVLAGACHPGGAPARAPAPGGAYDVVITNGRIVDGAGNAWFRGDLAVRGDRIARIAPAGTLGSAPAARRIDAHGMVVAPGFIDIQAQSYENFMFGDGRAISMVTQGITTAILGEGDTPAPVNDKILANVTDSTQRRAMQGFTGAHGFGQWLDFMQRRGVSENVGSFVGSGTVRAWGKGFATGEATAAELDSMRAMVRRAMEDGAFGIGSALIYPPNSYSSTHELIETAKAMAPYGGVYITHMRNEGDEFLEALDEAIRVGKEGGVPVEVYHLKAAGPANWPKMPLAIAKIDSARAAGQDVQADMYLYVAGANGFNACILPKYAADGKLLENLADAAIREQVKADLHRKIRGFDNLCITGGPENVMVTGFTRPELKQYEGKRLAEIARAMNKDWADVIIDLNIAEKANLGEILFLMSEENLKTQLKQPWMKFGTDAGSDDPATAKGMTHPRTYGNFPRLLGKYVRDERVLTLEDAVRKASSAVATRLQLHDRGLLKEGLKADIVIFDPATVRDLATFEKPHQLSVGMQYVLVNGVEVIRDGAHTGAKPGQLVRGPGWTGWVSPK